MLFDFFNKEKKLGKGAIPDQLDLRDRKYDEIAVGAPPFTEKDWELGFDIEKKLNITIPIKNQGKSSSCTGQALSYYIAILNTIETGKYDEDSAKSIYSQVALPNGGAYIRDVMKLAVNWGALEENVLTSYKNGNSPSEKFIKDLSWKTPEMDKLAKILQAKEYRMIEARDNMDLFAMAIRDNSGVVCGLWGENNGTWRSGEPKPPKKKSWGHALYFAKYGVDKLGKYIATPNSWGYRNGDELHPDGWQKLRQDYFNKLYIFNPWVLRDRPNIAGISEEINNIINDSEKKLLIEGEGHGRKGIIINGKFKEIQKGREADAAIYIMANNGYGKTISTKQFDEIAKNWDTF